MCPQCKTYSSGEIIPHSSKPTSSHHHGHQHHTPSHQPTQNHQTQNPNPQAQSQSTSAQIANTGSNVGTSYHQSSTTTRGSSTHR